MSDIILAASPAYAGPMTRPYRVVLMTDGRKFIVTNRYLDAAGGRGDGMYFSDRKEATACWVKRCASENDRRDARCYLNDPLRLKQPKLVVFHISGEGDNLVDLTTGELICEADDLEGCDHLPSFFINDDEEREAAGLVGDDGDGFPGWPALVKWARLKLAEEETAKLKSLRTLAADAFAKNAKVTPAGPWLDKGDEWSVLVTWQGDETDDAGSGRLVITFMGNGDTIVDNYLDH